MKYILEAKVDPDSDFPRRVTVSGAQTIPRVGEWIELKNGETVTVYAVYHRANNEILVRAR